jgi:hypothetical protein
MSSIALFRTSFGSLFKSSSNTDITVAPNTIEMGMGIRNEETK